MKMVVSCPMPLTHLHSKARHVRPIGIAGFPCSQCQVICLSSSLLALSPLRNTGLVTEV